MEAEQLNILPCIRTVSLQSSALDHAILLRDTLKTGQQRIVLAESCTAGRIAATLGALPGISNWLCGSFVVYRNDSKYRWLNVSKELLDDPSIGPVSPAVTQNLAQLALKSTPEADLCLAVTGEIGPGAIPELDGIIFCAMASRTQSDLLCKRFQLLSPEPNDTHDLDARISRLNEATERSLQFAVESIRKMS